MDPIDLDWQFTQEWPGDQTADGYVPSVGQHVTCIRASDDATRCGFVDDNRAGLFLRGCDGRKVVLTASLWYVRETTPCAFEEVLRGQL